MKLKDWLDLKKLNINSFCMEHRISPSHIYRLINNGRGLGRNVATKIEVATLGAVTKMELMFPEKKENQEKTTQGDE